MSGGLPVLTRTRSWASNSFEPSYFDLGARAVREELERVDVRLVLGGDDRGVDRDRLAGQVAEVGELLEVGHSDLPSPGDVPLALLLPSLSLPPQPARTSPALTRAAAAAIPRRVLRDRMRAFLSAFFSRSV